MYINVVILLFGAGNVSAKNNTDESGESEPKQQVVGSKTKIVRVQTHSVELKGYLSCCI